jgi:hypothetical protein
MTDEHGGPMDSERATHLAMLYLENTPSLSAKCITLAKANITGAKWTLTAWTLTARVARGLRFITDTKLARQNYISAEIGFRADHWELAKMWLVKAREQLAYEACKQSDSLPAVISPPHAT